MRLMILVFGLFLSSMALAQAKPAHYIFFIHGIGGNEKTFGVMPEAIAYHMNMEDPSQDFYSYRFVYKTEDPTLDTDDFALQLGEFMHKTLKNRIQPQDKISFVSHSQGGLVATIWYFHSFLQKAAEEIGQIPFDGGKSKSNYFPEYSSHMDVIATIGTPFWGSKLATLLISDSAIAVLARKVGKDFVEKTGRRQLEEMALGSRTIINFRKNVTSIPNSVLMAMRKNIRPINIAGAARLDEIFAEKSKGLSSGLSYLKEYAFGGRHFESDVAVSVPSAHFDSIYTLDEELNYVDGQITPRSMTYKTDFAPLTILDTIHASPWAEEVYDMAYVPSKCLADRNCDHPTYRYVLNHLLGKQLPRFGNGISADELGGFTASVRVNFPKDVDARNVKVTISNLPDTQVPTLTKSSVKIVMANSKEILSTFDFFHPTKKNVLFRTFTGHLEYQEDITFEAYQARKIGVPATLLVTAPGYKARYIETTLQPTFSTYIEINLEKK